MWFFWFMAGLATGWILLKRPDFIEKGIAWVKSKVLGA